MSQLPLADATPLRVIGSLFKDLIFAFEPQDVPDGARILRTLKGNSATIMDELEDASMVLVDPEHPAAPGLLQEVANKVALHYSWVNKSLNAGRPLLESDNWGDCKVTPDNIRDDFDYVPPPSHLQLQTPRPTPEGRHYDFSTPVFSQGSAGAMPPSSQPPYTPTPSHWGLESAMLQRQTPQSPSPNQIAPYDLQQTQSSNPFSSFPLSQPTDMGTMVYSQQPPWSSFRPETAGMIHPPTLEDFRRAYEVMMWFQRPPAYQHLAPPPTPIQPASAFQSPPPPPAQDPPSVISIQLGTSNDPPNSLQSENPTLLTSPQMQPVVISPPSPPYNAAGPSTVPEPLQTHPRLFEHAIGKPMMFCVPILVKDRGRIAEILRATGGKFVEDVEDADYVVLGGWEGMFFDETWYSAQDCSKPTVTPKFVFESYEKGSIMDPENYPTRGPEKPRRDGPRNVGPRPTTTARRRRVRGRGGKAGGANSPSSGSSEGPPKWLRFFKDAERTKSLQYIGAMLKKNSELPLDALAIHLNKKMSNHTPGSWEKYCLYHEDAIEDLRKRVISNAEKKATSKERDATTGTEAEGSTLFTTQQVTVTRQTTPQQASIQQTTTQQVASEQATSQQAVPQQPTSQQTVSQQSVPQQRASRQPTPRRGDPQQATPVFQQTASPNKIQPPPCEMVAEPGLVVVKTEFLDEDQLDFAFAVEMLSKWNANEESDAALWNRMETMRPSATAPTWEAFCEKNRSRFEHFFAVHSTQM